MKVRLNLLSANQKPGFDQPETHSREIMKMKAFQNGIKINAFHTQLCTQF